MTERGGAKSKGDTTTPPTSDEDTDQHGESRTHHESGRYLLSELVICSRDPHTFRQWTSSSPFLA